MKDTANLLIETDNASKIIHDNDGSTKIIFVGSHYPGMRSATIVKVFRKNGNHKELICTKKIIFFKLPMADSTIKCNIYD